MRIQYVSDIHLEFYKTLPADLITPEADILCLAGDIGYPYSSCYEQFLLTVGSKFKKIFLITGNHEYYNYKANYNYTMEDIENKIRQIIKDNCLNNVTFLDNSYEDYEGYRFVGSTLWSKVHTLEGATNDFTAIKEMSIYLYNELHKISHEFLGSPIVTDSYLPVIVITHYLPSFDLIADKYKTHEALNKFFASCSDDLFALTIRAWVYGHTHTGGEKELHGVKCVCNPVGYPGEYEGFPLAKVLEI